ncbi:MAG: thiamine phosphate synthase, partial [Candidatus Methanomethylophilaceae archaeon]|nr:thiamine phosphate synthase [Candidatus Methanomethylophilaceae archaeon]
MFDLYVITDRRLSHGLSEAEVARLAYAGGADIVQLRMKSEDGKEMLEQAKIIKQYADEYARYFIVNDRVDIAILSDADGVHLGQSDIPIA